MGGTFLRSLGFGAFVAASIGPIAILIISTASSHGLRSGILAGLGAALADLVYALLALSIGALLPTLLLTLVNLAGAAGILAFGLAGLLTPERRAPVWPPRLRRRRLRRVRRSRGRNRKGRVPP